MYQYLKRGCIEDRTRVFSVAPGDRTRVNEHKLKHWRFPLNITRYFFHFEGLSTCTGCPKTLWNLHPWRYLKAVWKWSRVSGSSWICRIDKMTPRDLFQCQPFHDSVITKFPIQIHLKLQLKITGILSLSCLHINLDANRKSTGVLRSSTGKIICQQLLTQVIKSLSPHSTGFFGKGYKCHHDGNGSRFQFDVLTCQLHVQGFSGSYNGNL